MSKNSVNIDKIKKELNFNSLFLSNYFIMGVSYMFGSFIFFGSFFGSFE